MDLNHTLNADIHIHDHSTERILRQILNTQEILMGKAEETQAALDNLTREVAESNAAAAGVVERLTAAKASAEALVTELQGLVSAGDTTLDNVIATAASLSSQLDTAQAELDAIAVAPPVDPIV